MKRIKPESQKAIESFEEVLKSLHSCLQSLARTIEKENKFLSQEQKGDYEKILEQKEELLKKLHELDEKVNSYEKKDSVDNLKPLVEKITKTYAQLKEVTDTNHILLKSNMAVSGKIIELYKAKQLEHTIGQLGYNKDGEMTAVKKLEKVMPAISLNNKV